MLDDMLTARYSCSFEFPAHPRIHRFSTLHFTGQSRISKAGTVLEWIVKDYQVKINVREVPTERYAMFTGMDGSNPH